MVKNVIIVALALVVAFGYYQFVYTKKPGTEVTPTPTTSTSTKPAADIACAQVITPARNPDTGDIREFPTPCDVPDGWEVIQNDIPDLELNLE